MAEGPKQSMPARRKTGVAFAQERSWYQRLTGDRWT